MPGSGTQDVGDTLYQHTAESVTARQISGELDEWQSALCDRAIEIPVEYTYPDGTQLFHYARNIAGYLG